MSSSVVSASVGAADGAERTCTTAPAVGESMVSPVSGSAAPNEANTPIPGLSAGKGWK